MRRVWIDTISSTLHCLIIHANTGSINISRADVKSAEIFNTYSRLVGSIFSLANLILVNHASFKISMNKHYHKYNLKLSLRPSVQFFILLNPNNIDDFNIKGTASYFSNLNPILE